MLQEPDQKYIRLHRKQKSKYNMNCTIFQTITNLNANHENADKWHWHHERGMPRNPETHIPQPKPHKNIHTCPQRKKQQHKTEPTGCSRTLKPKSKSRVPCENLATPKPQPEAPWKCYIKLLHIDAHPWDDHVHSRLDQQRKRLEIQYMELILPQFQNQDDKGTVIMQGSNIHKLEEQIKCISRRGFVANKTKIIHTSKKEHNECRCQHSQKTKRAIILRCTNLKRAMLCEQCMMTMNDKINTEYTWLQKWRINRWTFDLTFQNKSIRNTFMKRWMGKKPEIPTPKVAWNSSRERRF